jgi:transmembrane sensor
MPRKVRLHGVAYFEVTHDERHPFSVTNEISQVLVLGTKFLVSSRQESQGMLTTDVYVTEGKVGFSPKDDHAQQLVLTRGMKARLTANDDMPRLITAGSINQTAWATGIFHFDNTPLESVLRDLSEYYSVQLYCDNMSKRLSGDFHADPSSTNLQEIIHVIEQTLDVTIQIK